MSSSFPYPKKLIPLANILADRVSAAFHKEPWPRRGTFLHLLPKESVGAELGVFCGEFTQFILDNIRPKKLHLVDPWWLEFGELYPDWGAYTRHGQLPTKEAHQMVENIVSNYDKGEVRIEVNYSLKFLASLPEHYLDWVYLDTTHTYEDTIKELEILQHKVKPNGIIAGHDWHPDPSHWHHSVYRAIQDFLATHPYELIHTDVRKNWCIRRRATPAA